MASKKLTVRFTTIQMSHNAASVTPRSGLNIVISLSNYSGFKQHSERECLWLHDPQIALQEISPVVVSPVISPPTLFTFFLGSAHIVAIIKPSMDAVMIAVEHHNPCHNSVVTFDQQLFALAKEIQWNWPQESGEKMLVDLLGGLYIEMVALKTQ